MTSYTVHDEVVTDQPTAVTIATLSVDEIGGWLASAYDAVAGVIAARQAEPAGPPFARFHRHEDGEFTVEAGFPVTTEIEAVGQVQPGELAGGMVATTIHLGPYEAMEPAYEAVLTWIAEHGCEPAGDAWEVYFSDPAEDPDPAHWRTEIVQPYRQA
ncbi:MAG: GyrI-like domain-containing protein [Actinomycetota bacterium]|nr:GyrI-like domain-containing protein [Actinomycetota bacterium]